jgi:hypothetical protein
LSAQLIIASFEPVMETFERGNEPLFSMSYRVFLEYQSGCFLDKKNCAPWDELLSLLYCHFQSLVGTCKHNSEHMDSLYFGHFLRN